MVGGLRMARGYQEGWMQVQTDVGLPACTEEARRAVEG